MLGKEQLVAGISCFALCLLKLLRPAGQARKPLAYGDEEEVLMMDSQHGMAVRMVHGVPYPPMLTQAVVDLLRDRFTPRETDIFIATYPKCGEYSASALYMLIPCLGCQLARNAVS